MAVRPDVRRYRQPQFAEARAWVKAGGHGVMWETPKRALLLFTIPNPKDMHDLGMWSVLDLGKQRFQMPSRGRYAGIAWTLFPRGTLWIARRRAERDSIWPGPTRRVNLDCLACGACCKDNLVTLNKKDIQRFQDGGRPDLARRPIAQWREGKLALTLLDNDHCRYLGADNRCGIYALRPDACRDFPPGSECCLFAREEELRVHDGLKPGE
jgi:hypothetical protein